MALSDNLIAYFSLDEASGNALDATGGGNTLTDVGSNGTTTGVVSGARTLAGGGLGTHCFTHTDNASFSLGADVDFTWTMWVKNTDASPSGIAMLVKGTGGPFSGSAYQLWIDNSDGRTKFTVGNGASAQTVTDTNITNPFGSAGNWHFIVVWHDSVANQIGISVDTDTYTASWSSGTQDDSNGLTLGGDPNWAPDWKGAMDEVGFWKRTLTSTERTYLYNSGSGRSYSDITGGAAPLVARTRFVRAALQTAACW